MADERRAPAVSVIVPTYNRAVDLARCLDSLVAQTFRDFEVLVCDDGSTDETAAVVSTYASRLELDYHSAPNFGGPARPRNAGLRRARAPLVAFLDSDDWWAPEKLQHSVRALDQGADVVYHDLWIARTRRQRHYWRRQLTRPLAAPVFDDLLRGGNGLCNSSTVTRRALLERIGGFSEDPALISWEDYDAWLRIAQVTDRFERLDRPLGYYWQGGSNLVTAQRTIQNMAAFRERYLSSPRWGQGHMPGWVHYGLGRSYYQLGQRRAARAHMRDAFRHGLPPASRLKALVTMAMSLGPAR